jgi:Fe-S-cluster-containing dehydrogenase component
MPRWAIAFDVERCTGCYNCFLSCKDEFVFNDYLPYSLSQPDDAPAWIRLDEKEYGSHDKVKVDYVHILCQQCEEAPCIRPEFADAVYRRPDGIVIIDPMKAKGRKEIVRSCPYGAISWSEQHQVAQKCTLCAHMIDAGEKKTRCSEACPTEALAFGDLDDPNSAVNRALANKAARVGIFKPELGTKPLHRYMSLPQPFIGGEVVLADKPGDCGAGARVALRAAEGEDVRTTETDFLGDFEFKWLTNDVEYLLRFELDGYQTKELAVKANGSPNLGQVVLEPN